MTATRQEDNFMMDCENYVLENYWKQPIQLIQGVKRLENKEWIALIAEHTEIRMPLYISWVGEGGGDDFFLE